MTSHIELNFNCWNHCLWYWKTDFCSWSNAFITTKITHWAAILSPWQSFSQIHWVCQSLSLILSDPSPRIQVPVQLAFWIFQASKQAISYTVTILSRSTIKLSFSVTATVAMYDQPLAITCEFSRVLWFVFALPCAQDQKHLPAGRRRDVARDCKPA